jgi:hypothetical protein
MVRGYSPDLIEAVRRDFDIELKEIGVVNRKRDTRKQDECSNDDSGNSCQPPRARCPFGPTTSIRRSHQQPPSGFPPDARATSPPTKMTCPIGQVM